MVEDEYPSQKMVVLRQFARRVLEKEGDKRRQEMKIQEQAKEMGKTGIMWSKEKKQRRKQEVREWRERLWEELKEEMVVEGDKLEKEL